MSKRKYQVWWTDDRGNKIQQLEDFAYLNYTKIVAGIGTLNIGLPYARYGNIFRKDYKVEVWRAPILGEKRRLEGIYSMQRPKIRTRVDDNVTILDMSGHDPMGLLDRRVVKYKAGTSQALKTDLIDDMMKEIVDENMGAAAAADDADRAIPYSEGAFTVQVDSGLGATETKAFAYRNVLKILKELHQLSRTNTPRVYFDMVPVTTQQLQFQTFINQRGGDKRLSAGKSSFLFSVERGNLRGPRYEEDSYDEKNVVYVAGRGEGTARERVERENTDLTGGSLWGRREMFRDARSEDDTAGLNSTGDEELANHRPKKRFVADFLDGPGSRYGVDWDFGNLHTASYAGIQFDIEIKIVYVTVEDDGNEEIRGRNEHGEF